MTDQRCENCRFRTSQDGDGESPFICRRYPPTVDKHGNDRFPMVNDVDWCGEWKDKSE